MPLHASAKQSKLFLLKLWQWHKTAYAGVRTWNVHHPKENPYRMVALTVIAGQGRDEAHCI